MAGELDLEKRAKLKMGDKTYEGELDVFELRRGHYAMFSGKADDGSNMKWNGPSMPSRKEALEYAESVGIIKVQITGDE